jgi:translocation and assembly module TamB
MMNLVNRGRHKLVLNSPAKMEVAQQHFLLNSAHFDFVGASIVLNELVYNAGQISSRGELKGMPLAYLQEFVEKNADIQTDLTLGGNWQFDLRDKINGHLAVWRERGDVAFPSIPRPTLGLSHLTLDVDAANNQLRGRLEADGTNLGSLKAEAQSLLSSRNGSWGIAGDAPVQGNVALAMESLAWIKPLLDKTGALTFDGSLKALVRAGGTFAQPRLTGNINGDRFIVALPDQGLHFTEGRFQAELQDQALLLKDLTIRGGDGNLKGQGRVAFEGGGASHAVIVEGRQTSSALPS